MPLDDIRDIKPPIGFGGEYILLIVFTLLVALAVLVYFYYWRKRRKKLIIKIAQKATKLPYQIAFEALAKLKVENLVKEGKIKEYYFRLSDIIRCYIEDRFEIRASEMTTEEFLDSLRNSQVITGMHKNLVKEFLNLCDIVKFARYGPTAEECDQSFASAERLVRETKTLEEKKEEEVLSR